jgi:hypothetical protein
MGLSRIGEGRVYGKDDEFVFVEPSDLYYHEDYDQYVEFTRTGGKITQIDVWQDSSKTKYRSTATLSYTLGKVSQIVETLYLEDGVTVSGTVTTNITRQWGNWGPVTAVEVVRS